MSLVLSTISRRASFFSALALLASSPRVAAAQLRADSSWRALRRLGGDAWSQRTLDANIHRLGTLLQEALCGQDMLNFAGANTKGQCAHGSMRRGMRVAAHQGHARQRDTLLRANNMYNALASVVHVK